MTGVDVGDMTHVVIRKDAAGLADDWHLASVDVLNPVSGKRYVFACNDWLRGKVERTLRLEDAGKGAPITYKVRHLLNKPDLLNGDVPGLLRASLPTFPLLAAAAGHGRSTHCGCSLCCCSPALSYVQTNLSSLITRTFLFIRRRSMCTRRTCGGRAPTPT